MIQNREKAAEMEKEHARAMRLTLGNIRAGYNFGHVAADYEKPAKKVSGEDMF